MSRHYRFNLITVLSALTLLAACQSPNSGSGAAVQTPVTAATAEDAATDDAALAARVVAALQADPATRDGDIHVSVKQGRVRLSGFLETAAAKLRAGALAEETGESAAVDNRLILRHTGVAESPIRDARVHL